MKEIIVVTGNTRKIAEAREACSQFAISVIQEKLDIDEIQHHNPLKISEHKAEQAFAALQAPLVINDSSWSIPALKGFPGGYMKDVNLWFEAEDFIALMQNKTDRRIILTETIIYKSKDAEKVFQKDYVGEISKTPKGTGNALELVTIYNGSTIGEKHEAGGFMVETEDYIWADFAKWFAGQER